MQEQIPPRGDRRYRVHRSVKCYLAELTVGTLGGTWSIGSSIQRVVYRLRDGSEGVMYQDRMYPLQAPEKLIALIDEHHSYGGAVYVGGVTTVPNLPDRGIKPFPFIDITPAEERQRFKQIVAARSS
jgi:hypothetical protein